MIARQLKIHKIQGLTLVEMLLVFALAAVFIFLAVQQYQSYRLDVNQAQIKANVDVLARAMSNYYYANCSQTLDPATQLPQAKAFYVDADHPPPANNIQQVDLQNDLINQGFLEQQELIASPLLAANPYILQMNLTQKERTICVDSGCTSVKKIGTINIWQIQIAVLPSNTQRRLYYKELWAANCLSNLNGQTVEPCNSSANTGAYIVFQRSPSYPVERGSSDYWPVNPTAELFKQMYTTGPTAQLISNPDLQYFNCGG